MKRTEREKGAVLVEMAFMLPILTLIFLMVIDIGLVVREHQLLQNAAREGAHYSALKQNWISPLNPTATLLKIQQVVVDYCAAENITISTANVSVDQNYTIPLGGGLTAKGSLVTVTYTRPMLVLGRPLLPSGSMDLQARAVFRNLY
jgi:Flp pilus assembly protein TadG